MKRFLTTTCLLLAAAAAHAQVTISEAWVRASVPGQQASGAFMQIKAAQDVRLTGGSSPVAGALEVHEMSMEGGVMKMRQLEKGLPIARGATLELKPGSYHIMLMALKHELTAGQSVPITLAFENQSDGKQFTQQLDAPVRALNAAPPAHAHQH